MPRLYYGFRVDDARYVTLGLSDRGDLLSESAWFLNELDTATEPRITQIASKAVAATSTD